MSRGLLVGADDAVARWAWKTHYLTPMRVDLALGIVEEGEVVGAVLFQNWNGANVELSYYGRGTLTRGIARGIARVALDTLGAARVSVVTSKRNKRILRWLPRAGFRLEGTARCYYGAEDNARNTAVRWVIFPEEMRKIARYDAEEYERCSARHPPATAPRR